MKSPAFQFYVQDFLLGTSDFTAEEVGGYIRLLSHQWDKNGLPNDDKRLMQLSGVKAKALAVIKEKFTSDEDGFLRNQRLEKERNKQIEWRSKSSRAGIRSAQARKVNGSTKDPTNLEPTDQPSGQPNVNSSVFTLQSSSSEEKNKQKKVSKDSPISFKTLTEEQFYEAIATWKHDYSKDMLRAFFDYWREKDVRGKMKFQLGKTWDLGLRLNTWYQRGLSKGENFEKATENGKPKLSVREENDKKILDEVG